MSTHNPPKKHACSSPCHIYVTDIGTTFHKFPKGFFKSQFTLPSIPECFIDRFIKSPPTWIFKTNIGKEIKVPTLPTISPKGADEFTSFCSNLFFDFKSKINPNRLKNGKSPSSSSNSTLTTACYTLRPNLQISYASNTLSPSPAPPRVTNPRHMHNSLPPR